MSLATTSGLLGPTKILPHKNEGTLLNGCHKDTSTLANFFLMLSLLSEHSSTEAVNATFKRSFP